MTPFSFGAVLLANSVQCAENTSAAGEIARLQNSLKESRGAGWGRPEARDCCHCAGNDQRPKTGSNESARRIEHTEVAPELAPRRRGPWNTATGPWMRICLTASSQLQQPIYLAACLLLCRFSALGLWSTLPAVCVNKQPISAFQQNCFLKK